MERSLLYHCRALLMDEADTLLEGAYVVVEGETISSVGTQRPQGPFDREIDCGNNVLMPGLVNAHTHIPMTLMRGYGGGCELHTWLNQWIFPTEAKLDGRAVRAGTGLALAELIAGGVTTIADMYMHTTDIAQTVLEAGISANLSCGGVYFGAPADFSPATCKDCDNQRRLTEEWHGAGNGQILVDASIHGEYTSNVPLWQWMAAYAQEKKLGMHVHVSETQSEHEACKKRWGKTPLQILDRYGVWDTRAIAAHCVWTTEEDWALMAEKGVSCIHNPVSNLKLGSGVAWIPAMKRAGVNIALGTDGVSSNNNHDMFEEMKFAAILHNGVTHDPLALLPRQVLAMASRDGARALGRRTGQIVPGYTADLIVLSDLEKFTVEQVYKKGKLVAQQGKMLHPAALAVDKARFARVFDSFNMDEITPEQLQLKQTGTRQRVICLTPHSLLTTEKIVPFCQHPGTAPGVDVTQKIVKLAVFERHHRSGHVGLGFLGNYGLQRGAVASSIAHDSHNLIVAGTNDADMVLAGNTVRKNKGGLAFALNGQVVGELPLPVAGLMSTESAESVEEKLQALKAALKAHGISEDIDAFMTLAFVSLPVIPKLRLNTYGIVDVDAQQIVPAVF